MEKRVIMAVRFTNYFEHPSDNRYLIFAYKEKLHADFFEKLLDEEKIEYERYFEEEDQEFLFGIAKRYQDKAINCNFLTHAKYRNPMIRSSFLKYALLIITFGIISIALIGYLKEV